MCVYVCVCVCAGDGGGGRGEEEEEEGGLAQAEMADLPYNPVCTCMTYSVHAFEVTVCITYMNIIDRSFSGLCIIIHIHMYMCTCALWVY